MDFLAVVFLAVDRLAVVFLLLAVVFARVRVFLVARLAVVRVLVVVFALAVVAGASLMSSMTFLLMTGPEA